MAEVGAVERRSASKARKKEDSPQGGGEGVLKVFPGRQGRLSWKSGEKECCGIAFNCDPSWPQKTKERKTSLIIGRKIQLKRVNTSA